MMVIHMSMAEAAITWVCVSDNGMSPTGLRQCKAQD